MKINHNIQALNAYRNLYQNQAATSKNLERLSSGLRINRAADDAAGLAISEKMRSQIRGLKQAERNSLDGISLMQTAEGAMTEVHSMLQRMRELAVQAANDTNTTEDRGAIQKEIDQLLLEIDSIASKTEFNTRKLLDGSSAVDTQYIEGEMANTNIKGVPTVSDPSMETGLYQIDIKSTPEIVKKLNQPGAGVSTSDVIEFVPTYAKIDSNAAGINNVKVETATMGDYSVEVDITAVSAGAPVTSGNVTNATISNAGVGLTPGSYSINVTAYDDTSDPLNPTATVELRDAAGNLIGSAATVNLATLNGGTPSTLGTGDQTIQLDGLALTGTGSVTFNTEATSADVTVSKNGVAGTTKSVTFTNGAIEEETVDGLTISLDPKKIQEATTTLDVKGSELELGEYSIVVSGYQLDSTGRPSATIEVYNPDGFSIGKLAALIGGTHGDKYVIGTEEGRQVTINSSKITQAGTAKVQIEAKMEVSVSLVDREDNTDVTPITFSKELTTSNGVIKHGGLEMEFGANVKRGASKFDLTNKALAFQIGANTNQNVMIDVPQLSTVKLGIDEISVLDHESANMAVFKLEKAINQISATRSKLGATQNRLEHTINNLQVTHENLTSAESRIRDADMALEMTEFTKNNILNQSAQAMLAQANQLPQGVLQLLQG